MRKVFSPNFFVIIILLLSGKSIAQEISKNENSSQDVYIAVEIGAAFPSGLYKFQNYVSKIFKIPSKAVRNKVKGEILVQFVVEKDGSLSDIKVLKNLGYGLDEEAIRVFKLSPQWKPATFNGKKVQSSLVFRIYIDTNRAKKERIYF